MPNLFDGARDEPRIIIREEVLLPDYIPDALLHRDPELQVIADGIKPLVSRKTPENLFIHGPSGTGKTSCVKYVIKQLLDYSSNVLPVFVNCWENSTQLAVYNRIVEEMRLPLPRRGLATDEIFDRIMQYVRNYKKPILLILDDMDGLRHDELLYVVSRANEKGVVFGIIGIANDKTIPARLDLRIRSSLRFSEMEFKQYSEEQLASILRVRAEAALAPGSYDHRLLSKIAASAESGSARLALERLWKSAKRAEKANHAKIMIQDFEDILASESTFKLPELKLSSEETLILELLKEGPLESSALYDRFLKEIPKTKRQIRNYLDLLERKGLVSSEELERPGMLNSKMLKLKK